MDYIEAKVSYKSSKTNFISLPPSVVSMLYNANINSQDVICEIVWNNSKRDKRYAYGGWSGYSSAQSLASSSTETIEIDPLFASCIELKENISVVVNLKVKNYPTAKTVALEPISQADWELVELNAGVLENNLLYQTRCVAKDQTIVVYPSLSTNAKLKVLNFDCDKSSSFSKISNDTEFHIKPKTAPAKSKATIGKKKTSKSSTKSSRSSREKLPNLLLRGINIRNNEFFSGLTNEKYQIYLNLENYKGKFPIDIPYVNVSMLQGPKSSKEETTSLASVNPLDQSDDVPQLLDSKKIVAKLVHHLQSPNSHVGLTDLLAVALGIPIASVGHLIVVEPAIKPLLKAPQKLVFHPFTKEVEEHLQLKQINLKLDSEIDKKLAMKKYLDLKSAELGEIIRSQKMFDGTPITNCMRVALINDSILPLGGLVEFANISGGWVESIDIQNIDIELGPSLFRRESELGSSPEAESDRVVGQDQLLFTMENKLKRCNLGALLYGNLGSGKSVICKTLSSSLSSLGVYVQEINCEVLAMESSSSVLKKLEDIFKQISWHSPSLLVLENCELLIPSEQEQGDNSNSRQVLEFLVSKLMKKTMSRRKVGVLLTAKNKSLLNSLIFSSHLVEQEFNLKAPDKHLRSVLMQHFIDSLNLKITDDAELLNEIAANDTEGYLPGDLKILIDRVHFNALSSIVENNEILPESGALKISKENFAIALENFTPSSLRGVKLQKSSVKWEDIGGLRDLKSILLETLEWPTKYAPIFNSCPLRLRSGILLYGYPGCGKTLLASLVLSQCGLNFISIKGPEILNKYIGASEQSVRELFDRAQLAKPCILFFDEFDSIAPKRGHDSTGVTDRVVNQMLTQMDGAEGLDGVYVLAATSRPDLIDSALLRPGRLDKSVLCDIPDYLDRLDILQCITTKMDLDDDVDVTVIAKETEGYSGADLQAVGYNAYLLGVHEKLEQDEKAMDQLSSSKGANDGDQDKVIEFFQLNGAAQNLKSQLKEMRATERIELTKKLEVIFSNENGKSEAKDGSTSASSSDSSKVILKQRHFIEALNDTKPSISVKEKTKLANIYKQFLSPNEREGNMPDGMASNDIGGRTTLL